MNLSKRILLTLLLSLFVIPLLFLATRGIFAQTANVYFEPTPLVLSTAGETGSLELTLEGVSRLGGFEFEITFNPEIIQVDAINLLEPPAGVTAVPLGPNIDNENGTVLFGTLSPDGNILTGGTTVLATIGITAKKEGSSNLSFTKSVLLDTVETDFSEISVTATPGRVQVGTTSEPKGAADGWLVWDKNEDGVWDQQDEILKNLSGVKVSLSGPSSAAIPFCPLNNVSPTTGLQYTGELFYLSGRTECPADTSQLPEGGTNILPIGNYQARVTAPAGFEPRGAYYTDQSQYNGNPNAPSDQPAGRTEGRDIIVDDFNVSTDVTTHLSFLVVKSKKIALGKGILLPEYLKNYNNVSSLLAVENPNNEAANVTVRFYYPDGSINPEATQTFSLPAYGSKIIEALNITNLPDGFNGSAVVGSDKEVFAVVKSLPAFYSYKGLDPSQAATTFYLPSYFKNSGGRNTNLSIQNASTQTISDLYVRFYNQDGNEVWVERAQSILANGRVELSAQALDGLQERFETVGPELSLVSAPALQYGPALAYNPNRKEYLLVWADFRNETTSSVDLYGQRFNQGGSSVGQEFLVAGGPDAQSYPALAYNSQADNYILVWSDNRNEAATGWDVWFLILDGNGQPVGSPSAVFSSPPPANDYKPDIAYNSQRNEHLLVWYTEDALGRNNSYAARLDQNGAPLGTTVNISSNRMVSNQSDPAVAYNPKDNNYLVVWTDDRNSGTQGLDLYGRRLTPDLVPEPAEDFAVLGLAADQAHPALIFDSLAQEAGGGYRLSWLDKRTVGTGEDIYLKKLDRNGSAYPEEVVVTSALGNQTDPDLVFDQDLRRYLTAFSGNENIHGRFLGFTFSGSVVIQADQTIAAVAVTEGAAGFYANEAFALDQTDNTLHLPYFSKNTFDRDTVLMVQNIQGPASKIKVVFHRDSGEVVTSSETAQEIPPNGQVIFDASKIAELPAEFFGTVVISTTNPQTKIAATAFTSRGKDSSFAAEFGSGLLGYNAISLAQASSISHLPLMTNANEQETLIHVINVEDTATVDVTLEYRGPAGGEPVKIDLAQDMAPHAWRIFFTAQMGELPENFAGSAILTAKDSTTGEPRKIIALGEIIRGDAAAVASESGSGLSAYNGFAAAAPPVKLSLYSGWNKISWPANAATVLAPQALIAIDNQCGTGTALAVNRRKNNWLESFRLVYDGPVFNLSSNNTYYILVGKDCTWKISP